MMTNKQFRLAGNRRRITRASTTWLSPLHTLSLLLLCLSPALGSAQSNATNPTTTSEVELQAGAAVVDVTPQQLPVIRNGSFLAGTADRVLDPLHARALVLRQGDTQVAIVVVDSCMIPLDVCREAKQLAAQQTGIAVDRILISATHTHSAPSVMDYCLGTNADPVYRKFLPGRIAESIRLAHSRCQTAHVGATQVDARRFTHCRRWITRSDKMQLDPFGERTVHANMHPGHQNPDFLGPSGPADPWLSLLWITDPQGQPIAALANLSMHYFGGHPGISADFCGRFSQLLASELGGDNPNFVGITSQGTSGDLWWGDYRRPASERAFRNVEDFCQQLLPLARQAVKQCKSRSKQRLQMSERTLTMDRRTPDAKRLAWAKRMNKLRGDRPPRDRPEVYALQAEYLAENPTDTVVLQAIQVGDLAITAMPNEVYGLTGLKLKRQSPLRTTMNISLANGACGYIPPAEQHPLGGYNTWPSRTAGLAVDAESTIVHELLQMLEQISSAPRRTYQSADTPGRRAILGHKPTAYWPLDEFSGPESANFLTSHPAKSAATGRPTVAASALRHQGLMAYHLPGRSGPLWGATHETHAIQLAGGKLSGQQLPLGLSYTVQFNLRLGTVVDFRETTAVLAACGEDRLIVTGTAGEHPGRLAVGPLIGSSTLERDRWYQIAWVRNGDFVSVYADGDLQCQGKLPNPLQAVVNDVAPPLRTLTLGGDPDNTANLEGLLDEVAVYARALTAAEIQRLANPVDFLSSGEDSRDAQSARPDARSGESNNGDTSSSQLDSAPLSPQESLSRLHVRDGYRAELVAAEPLVRDPVAIDWAPDGSLWVAEMADYPMGMDGQGKPGGRIRRLRDTDGDGHYDDSQVLLEGVSFPNGVMAWEGGVLVTAAPEIFYAKDTTGDGRADVRKTLFSGFSTGNQQLRVNGLRWGLDGWVHCASGAHHAGFASNTRVRDHRSGNEIELGSLDFRFRPNSGELQPQAGPSQFGRVRDDWGNWFGVQNSQPLWHYVLRHEHLSRNPFIPAWDLRQQLRLPRMPAVFAAKPPQRRFHGFDHAGHYTSACGPCIYRDKILFDYTHQHAFTCEPFHNLVQHHVLTPKGSTFEGRRGDDGPVDFFASADRWTRPVMTRTGPDGALWVVDMYRYMIEHPRWLPSEGREALKAGYRAGDDRGRIYRIVRDGTARRETPNLTNLSSAELLRQFDTRNGPRRDQIHQQLLQRWQADNSEAVMHQPAEDITALRRLATDSESAAVRVHALALLGQTGTCDLKTFLSVCRDTHPMVRRQAVRLAESGTLGSDAISAALELQDDEDQRVRLQLAVALGTWGHNPDAADALVRLLTEKHLDRFQLAAAISSLPAHFRAVVHRLTVSPGGTEEGSQVDDEVWHVLLRMSLREPNATATLIRHLRGAENLPSDRVAKNWRILTGWLDDIAQGSSAHKRLKNRLSKDGLAELQTFYQTARRTIAKGPPELAAAAIGTLARQHGGMLLSDIGILSQQLEAPDHGVRTAALARLSQLNHRAADMALLRSWERFLPQTRRQVVSGLLRTRRGKVALLESVEQNRVQPSELSLAQQQSLLEDADEKLAARARNALAVTPSGTLAELLARYDVKVGGGDPKRGQPVFQQHCQTCHSLTSNQAPVGPDLRSFTGRRSVDWLTAILAPSQSIDPKYQKYAIVLKNGQTHTGIVRRESEAELELVDAEARSVTLSRSAIELVRRSSQSLMPDGFQNLISPRQMRDLLAYLRQL